MNGARVILECLIKEGVDTIFGYPGGAVIPLYDALYDYQDKFNHIRTSHEQGLVHAADGYARCSGKVGVCFLTSGPGATNSITGIATAYMDSTPLVVITGQVPTSLLGKDSFQEIDITGVTLSITKHNFLVRQVEEIVPTIKSAFEIANTGRKGPVLIDIPKDLFIQNIDFNSDNYISDSQKDSKQIEMGINFRRKENEAITQAIELINKSKKPVIYAGGGIKSSNSEDLLSKFAKKIDTPVLNTLMGLGGIDRKEELSLGMVGMHGSRESNLALDNSDLVIAVGARFSDRVIGKSSEFAKKAKIIHIDIDPSEVNKNINTDISIIGDVREILEILVKRVDAKDNCIWKSEINSYKKDDNIDEYEFHPKNILRIVNNRLGSKSVVVTDVGQHQMWAAKYWEYSMGKTLITSSGLGTMGFGLGAAIGTKLSNINNNVVLVTGDGSFKMNCNELATVSKYKIPILIILFNNKALGMVRQWQKLFNNQRYSQTDIEDNIDYVKLANAYNIDGHRVDNLTELNNIVENIDLSKPMLIECSISKDYDVYPIVPPNDTLQNLICN